MPLIFNIHILLNRTEYQQSYLHVYCVFFSVCVCVFGGGVGRDGRGGGVGRGGGWVDYQNQKLFFEKLSKGFWGYVSEIENRM